MRPFFRDAEFPNLEVLDVPRHVECALITLADPSRLAILPHHLPRRPEVPAIAKAHRWDPTEVLKALLAEEVAGQDRFALATRRSRAAFPTGRFAAWDPQLPSIPAPRHGGRRAHHLRRDDKLSERGFLRLMIAAVDSAVVLTRRETRQQAPS